MSKPKEVNYKDIGLTVDPKEYSLRITHCDKCGQEDFIKVSEQIPDCWRCKINEKLKP